MLRTQSATMFTLLGLVGSLLVLTVESRVGNSTSQICYETEQCLLFHPICQTDQYEVRHYEAVNLVTTEEKSHNVMSAVRRAAKRLNEYIKANQIDVPSPGIVKLYTPNRFLPLELDFYSLSYLLPAELQENPPKPTDAKVHITQMPHMTVYVRSFDGWITFPLYRHHAETLSSALDLVDAKYNKDYLYAAVYYSPKTLLKRYNEVWFVAEGEPVCSSTEVTESSTFA